MTATSARAELLGRAKQDPFFVANALSEFQEGRGWGDAQLARWLGTSEKEFWKLGLCRKPSDLDPDFAKMVGQIAGYAGCREDRLLQVLRESAAVAALRKAADWILMAARDRQEKKDENSHPDGGDTE